jgi:hypothetical protein
VSENPSQKQTTRREPRWIIGAALGAVISIFFAMGVPGGNASAGSREALISQAEELAEEHASRLGCDLAKNLQVIDAQYGTIGYDHQDLERAAALEDRAPAVHAVVALTCMNSAAATEENIFQQVIVGMDTSADEPRCRGIQSITKYDVTSHQATGYEVDFDASGNGNSVAKLRGACDFRKS